MTIKMPKGHAAVVLASLALVGCIESMDQLVPDDLGAKIANVFGATHESFEGRFINTAAVKPTQSRGSRARVQGAPLRPLRTAAFAGGDPLGSSRLFDVPGYINSSELRRYLHGIAAKLLNGYPGEIPDVQLHVIVSEAFGAYATPDDQVFITLATLRDLQSEDELAAVLAHELSHILLGHFKRQEYFDKQREITEKSHDITVVASAVSSMGVEKKEGSYQVYAKDEEGFDKKVHRASLIKDGVDLISDDVLSTSWGRRQEDEADLLGFDLLITAKYSASGAFEALERLESYIADRETRLDQLEDEAKQAYQEIAASTDLQGAADEVNGLVQDAISSAKHSVADWFKRRHADPADRKADLKAYARREYRRDPLPKPKRRTLTLQRKLLLGRTGQILANHQLAMEAQAALVEGDLAKAEKLARRSISGPTKNDPYTRLVMYSMRLSQGQPDKAHANLKAMRSDVVKPGKAYLLMAQAFERKGDSRRALRSLDQGAKTYGPELFYPNRIGILRNAGRDKDADKIAQRCQATKNEGLIALCNLAYQGGAGV